MVLPYPQTVFLVFALLLGLAFPVSASGAESEISETSASQDSSFNLNKLEGKALDEFLGIPDIQEDPPDSKQDRVCVYQCTLDFERDRRQSRRKLASTSWISLFGSQLIDCKCPTTEEISLERACPVLVEGASAEIRVACPTKDP